LNDWELDSRFKIKVFARKNFSLEIRELGSRLEFLCIKTVGAIGTAKVIHSQKNQR
jgi:hypothetical protein